MTHYKKQAQKDQTIRALRVLNYALANHLAKYRRAIVLEWARSLRNLLNLPSATNLPDPANSALAHKELDVFYRNLITAIRENNYDDLPLLACANHHEVLDHAKGLAPLLAKINTLGDIVRRSIVADPTIESVPALYLIDRVWGKLLAETVLLFGRRRRRSMNRITNKYLLLKQAAESVVDSSPVGILVANRGGVITHFNPAQELITGKRKEQVLGKRLYHDYAGTNATELQEAFRKAIDHGSTSFFKRRRYESRHRVQYLDILLGPIRDSQQHITGAIEILQDVTDKKELESKLIMQNKTLTGKVQELEEAYNYIGKVNRQFASLIDINNTLSTKMSLDKMLDFIVRSAAMMSKGKMVTLRRLDGRNLKLLAYYGLSSHQAKLLRVVPIDASVIGRVITSKKNILVVDLRNEPQFYRMEIKENLKLKTLVSVPLRSRGRDIGVLSIHIPEVRNFTNLELNFLVALANQAALAMELEEALAPVKAAKFQQANKQNKNQVATIKYLNR